MTRNKSLPINQLTRHIVLNALKFREARLHQHGVYFCRRPAQKPVEGCVAKRPIVLKRGRWVKFKLSIKNTSASVEWQWVTCWRAFSASSSLGHRYSVLRFAVCRCSSASIAVKFVYSTTATLIRFQINTSALIMCGFFQLKVCFVQPAILVAVKGVNERLQFEAVWLGARSICTEMWMQVVNAISWAFVCVLIRSGRVSWEIIF